MKTANFPFTTTTEDKQNIGGILNHAMIYFL